MPDFFFALLGTCTLSVGGRDVALLAALSDRFGRPAAPLVVAIAVAACTAFLMAAAGAWLGGAMPPSARLMLVAMVLILAAFELAWVKRRPQPVEPTRSLFALGAVLALRQLSDAPRLLLLALAAWRDPALVALGGLAGGALAMAATWWLGARYASLPLRPIRMTLAVMLLIGGAVIGWDTRGLIG